LSSVHSPNWAEHNTATPESFAVTQHHLTFIETRLLLSKNQVSNLNELIHVELKHNHLPESTFPPNKMLQLATTAPMGTEA